MVCISNDWKVKVLLTTASVCLQPDGDRKMLRWKYPQSQRTEMEIETVCVGIEESNNGDLIKSFSTCDQLGN